MLQLTTYKIPKEDGQSFHPFVFNDMMGLERSEGVLVDDVKLALRGHMRDGYQVQLLQMIFCVFISILKLEVV